MDDKLFTIPNIVSLSRLILAWPIASSIYFNQLYWLSLWVSLAIFSDFLDGYLSRLLNQQSNTGKIIDPIIDSVLIFSGLIALSLQDKVPLWYLSLVIIRYCIIVFILLLYSIRSSITPASITSGKWSICAMTAYLICAVIQAKYPIVYRLSLTLSVGMMLVSLIDYIHTYRLSRS